MQKICHITTDSKPGGTEKIISVLLEKMNKFKHSLIVLKKKGYLNDFCNSLNIENIACGINLFKLIFFIRKQKPDIVMSYLFHSNIIARILGRLCGIKTVICGQRNIDPWRKKYHILLDRWTSPLCDMIISNSYAGKKRLIETEKIPEEKITVIYNGVDIPEEKYDPGIRKKYGLTEKEILLLCPASFSIKKGHVYLIEAFQKALETNNNIKLILAGEGRIKLNINNDKIILAGTVNPITPLILASDIVVLPSLWEGMPNVILEAFACKKPVIASNVGGIPEIVNDNVNGLLVPPGNIEKLSEAIIYLVKNPDLRQTLGTNGYKTVTENYSQEKMVQSFSNILNITDV